MTRQIQSLRLVVASPGDVRKERDIVSSVVEEINNTGIAVDLNLHIKVVRWETDAFPGFNTQGPQGLIDPLISIKDSDFVIGIFWKRFGTPTAEAQSGTAHELQRAFEAWKEKGSPHVMVYFSQQPYTPQTTLETDQWGQVIEFRNKFPKEGLWWPYNSLTEFNKLLRTQLTSAIRARFSAIQPGAQDRPPALAATASAGSAPAPVESNIPPLWHRTVGRKTEIQELRNKVLNSRLVTLTGPGGCGKTRVAIEVANAVRDQFSDGVLFVELASLAAGTNEGLLIPSRIATLAGIREQAKRPPTEVLAEHFGHRHLLLVLDNCEHLAASCAENANYLIRRCVNLRILATSRVPLRIPPESTYPLGPLGVPEPDASNVADTAGSEAVQMFIERAALRKPDYNLDESNAAAIARLCRALDGLPLAIEVAAARLAVKSVEDMSRHSEDLLKSLGETKSGDFRQWDTLTAAVKWSYDLLPAAEAGFMRRLAVFNGGWTEAAAEAVCVPASERDSVGLYLQTLYDHSLIASRDANGSQRFRFLEPIRQFALQRMAAGEKKKTERKRAEYFLKLSREAAPELLGAKQVDVLQMLQAEVDNLRACIRWAVANHEVEMALGFIAGLWRFCEIRGYFREGRERARDVLAIPGASDFPKLRSEVLSGAGILAFRQGDFEAAEPMFEESLAIERTRGNEGKAGIANALSDMGKIARIRGDFARAHELYTEGLEIERELGNGRQIAVALNNLGVIADSTGDYEAATALLSESVTRFASAGNVRESAFPLNFLARVEIALGHFEAARLHAEKSLANRNQVSDRRGVAETSRTLTWMYIEMHDYTMAKKMLKDSIAAAMEVGDKQGLTESLDLAAMLDLRLGNAARSVPSFAAAEASRQTLRSAIAPTDKVRRDSNLAAAKEALGPAEYDRLWREGSALSLDAAVAQENTEETARAQSR